MEKKELLTLILVAGFFFLYSVNSSVDGGDSATYLVGAKAIVSGSGYFDISKPIAVPIQHFPPGYSFFLAGVFFLTGFSVVAAKIANVLLMLLSIILAFGFFRKFFAKNISLLLAGAFAFNLAVLWYSHRILSEPLFIFSLLIAVFFSQKFIKAKNTFNFYFFASAAFLVIAFFVRSIGITFAFAVVGFLFLDRQPKKAITLAASVFLPVALWAVYSTASFYGFPAPSDSYVNQIFSVNILRPELGFASPLEIFLRFAKTFIYYAGISIPTTIFSPLSVANFFAGESALLFAAGLFVSAVFFAGFLGFFGKKQVEKKFLLLQLFLVFYLAVVFLVPYNYQAVVNRVLLPVILFLLLFFARGLLGFLRLLNQRKLLPVSAESAFVLVFSVIILASIASDLYYASDIHERQFESNYKNFEISAHKLAEIVDEKSLVFTDSPERLFLISGVKSQRFDLSKPGFTPPLVQDKYALVTGYYEPTAVGKKLLEDGFVVVFVAPDNVTKILRKQI